MSFDICNKNLAGHFLVQNRCSYSSFFNTYLSVVVKFPSEFYDSVVKLGFGHFLHNANVVVNSYHLDNLVGRYIGNFEFQVKDKVLKMSVEDVGHILGISYTGRPIYVGREDDTSHQTVFWKKYFGVTQVTRCVDPALNYDYRYVIQLVYDYFYIILFFANEFVFVRVVCSVESD